MPLKLLAFGASNSRNSINKKLATWTAGCIPDADINLVDLNDFEMPIYSIDREKEAGIPTLALEFKKLINEADALLISFAEHNGSYTVAFKNIFDWISRFDGSPWDDKPMFLLSTSPGGRGGKTVLGLATASFQFMNKNSISSFSLPSFHKNFSEEEGITDSILLQEFNVQMAAFLSALISV